MTTSFRPPSRIEHLYDYGVGWWNGHQQRQLTRRQQAAAWDTWQQAYTAWWERYGWLQGAPTADTIRKARTR